MSTDIPTPPTEPTRSELEAMLASMPETDPPAIGEAVAELARAAQDVMDDLELEDFDAFWSSRGRKPKRTRIRGIIVELPPSLPLQFEMEAKRLSKSSSEDDVRKLVHILVGEETFDRLVAAKLDVEEFQLLLAWAPRAIAGVPVSLAEVAAELAEAMADKAGEDSDPS